MTKNYIQPKVLPGSIILILPRISRFGVVVSTWQDSDFLRIDVSTKIPVAPTESIISINFLGKLLLHWVVGSYGVAMVSWENQSCKRITVQVPNSSETTLLNMFAKRRTCLHVDVDFFFFKMTFHHRACPLHKYPCLLVSIGKWHTVRQAPPPLLLYIQPIVELFSVHTASHG